MTASEMILKIIKTMAKMDVVAVEPALDGINESVKYLALKLADRNSDLAKGTYAYSTVEQSDYLPTDFCGLAGKPSVDGKSIEPLPSDYDETTVGPKPEYYDVAGTMLFLYPSPLSSVTVSLKYWVLPEALGISDDIPYEGLFDSLITSMAIKFSIFGHSVLSKQEFVVEVEQGLNNVLMPRRPALPLRRPTSFF